MASVGIVTKKRKEKTTPFSVNLMRSQVLYRAAQGGIVTKVKGSACLGSALVIPQIGN